MFLGGKGQPKLPVLVAENEGRPIAWQPVPLWALDMEPFMSILLKRYPQAEGWPVAWFFTPLDEERTLP